MNLVADIHRLIALAESGKPRLRSSTLWKNKVLDVLKAANRAEFALRYQDKDDEGACDGPWEDEECERTDQVTHYGQGMNSTRIERLQRRLESTSMSSMAETYSGNVTVLKP